MNETYVFRWIGDAIKLVTDKLLIEGVANVTSGLSPLILSAVTLYITVRAWLLIWGNSDGLFSELIVTSVKIVLITFLTLNASNYTQYVIETVNGWELALTSLIVPQSQTNTVMGMLDVSLNTALDQIAFAWEKIDYSPSTWGWAFAALVIMIAYLPLTIVIAILVIGAQFMLTVLLIIGPIFISFAMFPITRRFFDSWIAKVFENVLVLVFGVMIIGFVMSLFNQFVISADLTKPNIHPIATSLMLVPIVAILYYIVRQIPNLAGALSGGFASANLTFQQLKPGQTLRQIINDSAKFLAKDKEKDNSGSGNRISEGKDVPNLGGNGAKEQIQSHNRTQRRSGQDDSSAAQNYAASQQLNNE
ncbi:type IV secretion system protein [Shewanella oncorhynchi]|jgi:type IV secretion system protein VirB6|uniref:type IV secretion system protein n=1 Tax=Shewanella oncorhynchi TaxID=2726434 RepID=UPI003D7BE948